MEEISIYHPPGQFIYTVWDKDSNPLYVGGTRDIMAKSFKFDFDFADITGEYWPYPSITFETEIDERIAQLKPQYNSRLRTSMTKRQIMKYCRDFFKGRGLPFASVDKRFIIECLEDFEGVIFKGEKFYTLMERGELMEIIRGAYGIHGI